MPSSETKKFCCPMCGFGFLGTVTSWDGWRKVDHPVTVPRHPRPGAMNQANPWCNGSNAVAVPLARR